MKEQFQKALDWALNLEDINACVTGSGLLGYFDGAKQDIDIFVFDKGSMNALLYKLKYDKMFQILDPLEKWKEGKFLREQEINYKQRLITVKYKYNLCIDINIILKKDKVTTFDVLSSFDLDIICKGYDIKTKQYLDLTTSKDKECTWNKWNTKYYSSDIWDIKSLLRQFSRCIKYYKRGYNTDPVVKKYLEMLNELITYNNIFNSKEFEVKVKSIKANGKFLKTLLEIWLEKHSYTEEEMELLLEKSNEL